MKKLLLIVAIWMIGTISSYNTIEAQGISVSVNINIGRQPAWGPVGYDYVEFYYLPEINCYYSVNLNLFYYFWHGRWVAAQYLPYAYSIYDLYGMYKVVLVNVFEPWRYNQIHVRDYARYRGNRTQVVIRDSRDVRYKDSRNNNARWYSENTNNNYRRSNDAGYRDNNNRNDSYNYNNRRDNNNRNDNMINRRDNDNRNDNTINRRDNNSRNDNTISRRDNNSRNDNAINNNARRNDNTGQQRYNENRQFQRNSGTPAVSERNNRAERNSVEMRSGSSGRSQEHNRSASSNERRSRDR